MSLLYPLTFHPVFKERVWGGRELEHLYQKKLPPKIPIGESWEISDRPGDESVIANGPLAGKNLRWLMEHHADELLGKVKPTPENRFPLLCKILDARDKLSLQVHPPASKAATLGGEPKTEMWYITDAVAGAELYVGLKPGVTRAQFEKKIQTGEVADCFHRIPVRAGDTMFLPSGRVHAIGAGLVIFEIQQNSDTTYRVFDWNRVGLDGKPRELHIPQSLASIDFNDFAPPLATTPLVQVGSAKIGHLVRDPLFNVDIFRMKSQESILFRQPRLRIVAQLENQLMITSGKTSVALEPGQFCLLPACLEEVEFRTELESNFLYIEPGQM
jgi:mannose-6-phosphate isomerase